MLRPFRSFAGRGYRICFQLIALIANSLAVLFLILMTDHPEDKVRIQISLLFGDKIPKDY